MIKKIILLVIGFLSVTGCSINYNLTIDGNNNFKEEVIINADNENSYTKESMYNEYLEEYPIYIDQEFLYYDPTTKIDEYEYYEKSYKETINGYVFNYKSEYDQRNFNRARSLNTVFSTIGVGYLSDENYYYISLKNCTLFNNNSDLTNIAVNITFKDLNVLYSNANYVNGNTYTWNLYNNGENSIDVKYSLKENEKDKGKDNKNDGSDESPTSLLLVFGLFITFIIVLSLIIKVSKKIRK